LKALPILLFLLFLSPIAFAASDCEHTCCTKFNGSWDEDFDDCKHPAEGFDTCLSDCEAAVWAARPQGPDTTGGSHYGCKVGFILLGICAASVAYGARR